MKNLFFCLVLLVSISVQAQPLTSTEKLSDLDQLIFSIKSGYGPLEYKREHFGIDVDALRALYAPRIAASRTNGEFFYLVRQFVAEFHDSHFMASVPTDKVYYLPFYTDYVQGKVVLEQIDRASLPATQFPFNKGDEIVELDGRPIMEVVAELMPYLGMGYTETSRRLSAMTVSVRNGTLYPAIRGPVSLKIIQAATGSAKVVNLKWREQGDGLDEQKTAQKSDFRNLSMNGLWRTILGTRAEAGYMCSGDTRIKIPAGATIIRKTPFVAYYHPTAKGNVGYLRIPHYDPKNDETGEDEAEERFLQYREAVQILEAKTVGLIIDQDHNCGGRVDYLQAVVSLFFDKPFAPVLFTLLGNKKQYMEMREMLDSFTPGTSEYDLFHFVVQKIKEAWDSGQFMTGKLSFDGSTEIQPNEIHYTKPIVMLIDELSGSGGDAFPSQMQGLGRAKLLGTRTMGAGGHVEDQPALNYSQITYGMTKSLFYRPDGTPVENNGAVPDYPYAITHADFLNGYQEYQTYYLKKLLELIP